MKVMFVIAAMWASTAIGFGQSGDCDTFEKCLQALKANPKSSLVRFRIGELFFLERDYQSAANEFRNSLEKGDGEPAWTRVWSHINLGKIFDITDQRERAVNQYKQAQQTNDNTQDALDEAARYLKSPYTGN
jgi:tetratricopeptide (TPR) repeat protein